MIKKVILLSLLGFNSVIAHADEFYASIYGGLGNSSEIKLTNNTLDTKNNIKTTPIVFNAALGSYLNPNVRTDISGSYIISSAKEIKPELKIRHNSLGVMLNAYYDFLLHRKYSPYVMAGVGYVKNNFKVSGDESNALDDKVKGKAALATQFGAGLHYEIDYTMKLHVGYRFLDTGSEKIKVRYAADGSEAFKASSDSMHLLIAGIHFDF
jgi:opacity protein-like surface antigen